MMKLNYVRCFFVAGLVSLAVGVSGCCTTPKLPREVDDALVNWLECEDCLENEFESLTDYCEKYVAARLALIATEGPPPEVLQAYEGELRSQYQRRKTYADTTPGVSPPAITEDQYVDMYTASLIKKQKSRAFAALKAVNEQKNLLKWIDDAPATP